jgi:hypothetical protein
MTLVAEPEVAAAAVASTLALGCMHLAVATASEVVAIHMHFS